MYDVDHQHSANGTSEIKKNVKPRYNHFCVCLFPNNKSKSESIAVLFCSITNIQNVQD